MKRGRTYNGIRNVLVSFWGTIVNILLQFIGRTYFVRLLSAEYLGLSGLFADILNVLALSELGVGSAMAFALYKPVADSDTEKIKSIMHLYKRLYFFIGSIIIGAGILVTPFLHYLIKEMPDIQHIHLFYIMYVLNSGISYFFVYKKSLLICCQEEYIASLVAMIASFCNKLFQIVILIVTRSFLLYLVIQIIFTFLENFIDSVIADKRYPFLKSRQISSLGKEDIADIKKNIRAMMAHKIGTVVVKSTDSIIISRLLGLAVLGKYANYNLIMYNITAIIQKMLWTLTASLGNLVAKTETRKSEGVFFNILFASFWIHCFCATCIFCLINPFIKLWIGEGYLLSIQAVAIFSLCFFMEGMRQPALLMRDATGTFYNDRYKPLVEAAVNLVISIPLTYRFGIAGVKMGTIISYVSVALWVEGYILYKHYFKQPAWEYFGKLIKYFVVAILLGISTYGLCSVINSPGVVGWLFRAMVSLLYPNLLIVFLYRNKPEFNYFLGLLKLILFHKNK